jgi:hypothetical protein
LNFEKLCIIIISQWLSVYSICTYTQKLQMALGDIAQLGERLVRNQKVRGSIPLISTKARARGSVGERLIHIQEVAGSKPAAPTKILS